MYDPSGYFLIEELFCNDMRDPKAIDYSEPILDWLKNSKGEALAKWECILSGRGKARKVLLEKKPLSKLPNFKSVDMDKTRFCDLGFRLGAGYLYCHQIWICDSRPGSGPLDPECVYVRHVLIAKLEVSSTAIGSGSTGV
ncbi:snRNA-activating protein complex subunit-like [Silene latifolia]|uniref:snRNA-activating protein complex subunit-like n=1 Tax=Silene latifolia TaxID=37657 RepID=UPI003D7821E0